MSAPDFLYRYEEVMHAPPLDEYENCIGRGSLSLYLHRYQVLKETPCGVWISIGWSFKKFVNLTRRKKYACASPELAWESFIARKERQYSILSNQLDSVRVALKLKPERAVQVGF